jgi:hypothetical protein
MNTTRPSKAPVAMVLVYPLDSEIEAAIPVCSATRTTVAE